MSHVTTVARLFAADLDYTNLDSDYADSDLLMDMHPKLRATGVPRASSLETRGRFKADQSSYE
jgi:dolichyl-phosphate-mannose--protein O-mannosyl transferase